MRRRKKNVQRRKLSFDGSQGLGGLARFETARKFGRGRTIVWVSSAVYSKSRKTCHEQHSCNSLAPPRQGAAAPLLTHWKRKRRRRRRQRQRRRDYNEKKNCTGWNDIPFNDFCATEKVQWIERKQRTRRPKEWNERRLAPFNSGSEGLAGHLNDESMGRYRSQRKYSSAYFLRSEL